MPGAAAGVKQGVESGTSAELSVEMPGTWLKLALQSHHSRLARAVYQFEDCRMPRVGYCSLLCSMQIICCSLVNCKFHHFRSDTGFITSADGRLFVLAEKMLMVEYGM